MGKINDVSQLCPFLKAWRKPTNDFMASFKDDTIAVLPIPSQVKTDWEFFKKVIWSAAEGLPIADRTSRPPLNSTIITSDAAGALTQTVNGVSVIIPSQEPRGAAAVGLDESGAPWFISRITWPEKFLTTATDGKGSFFGAKSTTLEMIGLLLPFLAIPSTLANKHITLQVDNIAVVFGWINKQMSGDVTASIMVRALTLIEAFLGCKIHVRHLPRMSAKEGVLADHLSRGSTTSRAEKELIRDAETPPNARALENWFKDPSEDWSLAIRILEDVQNRMFKTNKE